ncbi:MAG: type II toxin-antitoxin system death-on-curing family toxin [Terracidiphilus sp.]|nr:type II toxin-antitoxin system death-on-curing family toxin [Terracidiphilus sp.]MDR3798198.1 type II toxin-antitoxin system death-on-curing family toxin [Terracidiphilus sp.]
MNGAAWRWIGESSALAIHDEQIAEHGGAAGVRDLALLQSELAPENIEGYGNPDIAALAAAYAVGITLNRAFLDGNKRTAWVVTETFLLKNGYELIASDRDGVMTMLSVADGTMSEPELAIWLRAYIRPCKAE